MKTKFYTPKFYHPAEDIFEYYQDSLMAVFLDSSLENQLGQYSIIGLYPYLILSEKDQICFCNGIPQKRSFEELLQYYLDLYREENPTDLPLISGAIGYFSYDYGRKFEHIQSQHPKKINVPEAIMAFYDVLIIDNKQKKELTITARGELQAADFSINQIIKTLKNVSHSSVPQKHSKLAPFIADFTKEDYKKAVDEVISYITEGDIYIMNMTQQLEINSSKQPYDVYRYLRTYNPAPFSSYFQYGDFQIVGASPERFMKISDGIIETRPIKGTRKRGKTSKEDNAMRQELMNSSKDHSELLMIVDLERNDLNHICQPGSVQVTKHFDVEAYATVFHLVTTIIGKPQKGLSISDFLRATFPGGSITGAPKIRSMEIIDKLEHNRRNIYTGSMGYLSLDGNCDLNIIIRTAIHQNEHYYLGVGGGITCESDLEFEYEETIQKAKALLEAMWEEKK